MSESSAEIDTQRAFDMIHRDAIAHISAMKQRQWAITNYALLLLGVLFVFSSKIALATYVGKGFLSLATVAIGSMWCVITYGVIRSLAEKRSRLNRLYKRFGTDAKAVYGEINSERESLFYDCPIVVCLFLIVLSGMTVVIANIFAGVFL